MKPLIQRRNELEKENDFIKEVRQKSSELDYPAFMLWLEERRIKNEEEIKRINKELPF